MMSRGYGFSVQRDQFINPKMGIVRGVCIRLLFLFPTLSVILYWINVESSVRELSV